MVIGTAWGKAKNNCLGSRCWHWPWGHWVETFDFKLLFCLSQWMWAPDYSDLKFCCWGKKKKKASESSLISFPPANFQECKLETATVCEFLCTVVALSCVPFCCCLESVCKGLFLFFFFPQLFNFDYVMLITLKIVYYLHSATEYIFPLFVSLSWNRLENI